jgi:sulfopyruvate decarboxylase alpha subunit
MSQSDTADSGWKEKIFKVLKEGNIRQVSYVPDAGHALVIRKALADPDMKTVVLTTEEEGVALGCGAWLGGDRSVLLMQSSGVGNCVNMFSLLESCQIPFLTLVTMRGEHAEFNPWQSPMTKGTQGVLELMGFRVHRVTHPEDVEEVTGAALDSAFEAGERVAVLLSQRLIGRKKWTQQ